jgi:hypothetical protein
MSDKEKLDLLCKVWKLQDKCQDLEERMKSKWVAMSLTSTQKKNKSKDLGNRLYF